MPDKNPDTEDSIVAECPVDGCEYTHESEQGIMGHLGPGHDEDERRAVLVRDLRELAEELGHTPLAREIDDHGMFSASAYTSAFESLENARIEADLDPDDKPDKRSGNSRQRTISDEELFDELRRIADELGHSPRTTHLAEFDTYHPSTFTRDVDSWDEIIEKAGLEPVPDWRGGGQDPEIPSEELIRDVRRVDEIVDRTPRSTDMRDYGEHHENTARNRFGSWEDFLVAAGLETYDNPWPTGEEHPSWNGVEVECEWCGESKLMSRYRAKGSSLHFCEPEDGGTHSECRRQWLSEVRSGEEHPSWTGGMAPYGPGWNERKRERVRERDNRRCQNCGRTEEEHLELYGKKHHVHHIQKARSISDPERRNQMENLITLCNSKDCHFNWEQMSPLRPQVDLPSDDD